MEEIYYPPYKNGVPDSLKLTQPMAILSVEPNPLYEAICFLVTHFPLFRKSFPGIEQYASKYQAWSVPPRFPLTSTISPLHFNSFGRFR